MNLLITKKYLLVPVNTCAVTKKLCFYDAAAPEKPLLMDFDCKLDAIAPDYTAFVDVSRFLGRELVCECEPQMEVVLTQSDERTLAGAYREEMRPFVHYTPLAGWINDPNGLIFYHGVYHMFYQYNPMGIEWGNMHWGHATSRDLFHWKEEDVALFPDAMGTMYSGSAIEDTRNVSGLQRGDRPPLLLYYTAAGNGGLLSRGKKRTQCLAVSTDGGKSFAKYENNPLVEPLANFNRDPKVVWVEELSRFVMALYLEGERYALLGSGDLLHWTPFQEILLGNDAECPDLFCLEADGGRFWVFLGASDKYLVGRFDGGKFVRVSDEKQLSYSPAHCSYAAQSFSGVGDGRVLRLAWDKLLMPSLRVPNQMSVPTELTLSLTDKGYYLSALPAREIEGLYLSRERCANVTVKEPYRLPLARAAYDIRLVCDADAPFSLDIFGHRMRILPEENRLEFQKTSMPLSLDRGRVDLRLIVDRCSTEIFADGGKFCATFRTVCDYNLPYVGILPSGGAVVVRELVCNRLSPVHDGV